MSVFQRSSAILVKSDALAGGQSSLHSCAIGGMHWGQKMSGACRGGANSTKYRLSKRKKHCPCYSSVCLFLLVERICGQSSEVILKHPDKVQDFLQWSYILYQEASFFDDFFFPITVQFSVFPCGGVTEDPNVWQKRTRCSIPDIIKDQRALKGRCCHILILGSIDTWYFSDLLH